MRIIKRHGFNIRHPRFALVISLVMVLAGFFLLPAFAQAQYGMGGASYTQTANLDNCTSSSVSLNTMAINQFYLYSASGVSVLYAAGVNNPGTGNINLQSALPVNATIVRSYLEVVEQGITSACGSSPVSFGGGLTTVGLQVGQGNLENNWIDPRYGIDILGGNEKFFACDVRYDVTSLVTPGTSSYITNAAGVMECLVVVYTLPAPASCGSVALGDGLFLWDGASNIMDWGVTPWCSTLDWSCQHNNACAANQFSRWGGVSVPTGTINFTDEFFGTASPDPAQPPNAAYGGGTIFQDSSTINDTFLDTYNNVPLSSPSGKITWALGNPLSGGKAFYYVNLLAASCNSICATATPSNTPTVTDTGTSTFTPTITSTPTLTNTFTSSFTFTYSPTVTPTETPSSTATTTTTSTPTQTWTNTGTFTFTSTLTSTATFSNTFTSSFTPTDSPTDSITPTPSPTHSATASSSPTHTPTFTLTKTPSATASNSPTATESFTATFTSTSSNSPTSTPTSSPTKTPSDTMTATPTDSQSATPTFTLSNIFTFTQTPTSTPTHYSQFQDTATPTPTFNPIIGIVIYPNPVKGDGDHATCRVSPCSNAVFKIFTTAFRKVNEMNWGEIPATQDFILPLKDAWGTPLANGIYYVVVSTKSGRWMGKLVVIR